LRYGHSTPSGRSLSGPFGLIAVGPPLQAVLPITPYLSLLGICHQEQATRFDAASPSRRRNYPSAHSVRPNGDAVVSEYEPIVHRLRSLPRSLGLGPTNPTRTNLPSEPLGVRWPGFSPSLRYSYRHSHFVSLQPSFRSTFLTDERSPTTTGAVASPQGAPTRNPRRRWSA